MSGSEMGEAMEMSADAREEAEERAEKAESRALQAEQERDELRGPIAITATPSAAARIQELLARAETAEARVEELRETLEIVESAHRKRCEISQRHLARVEKLEEALRRMIAVTELGGTRSELSEQTERAKSSARAALASTEVAE